MGEVKRGGRRRGLSPMDRSSTDGRRQQGLMSQALALVERAMVEDALAWAEGVKSRAADALGVSRATLDKAIDRNNFDPEEIRIRMLRGQYLFKTEPEGAPWVAGATSVPARKRRKKKEGKG